MSNLSTDEQLGRIADAAERIADSLERANVIPSITHRTLIMDCDQTHPLTEDLKAKTGLKQLR